MNEVELAPDDVALVGVLVAIPSVSRHESDEEHTAPWILMEFRS